MKQKVEFQKLVFNIEEQTKISSLKKNRFSISVSTMVYPKTSEDLVDNFLKSIRFLENIKNNILSEQISEKIKSYFKENAFLIDKIKEINMKIKTASTLKKYVFIKKIDKITLLNSDFLNSTIDSVLDLGREDKKLDPVETQGYY